MRLPPLAVMLACASCTAQLGAGAPVPEDTGLSEVTAARRAFDEGVAPRLEDRCRFCHGDPAMAPAFLLASPDAYSSVTTWPSLIDLDLPEQSRLLTRGEHDGPAWSDEDASTVLAWLRLEQLEAAADGSGPPVTAVTDVVPGVNAIDLTPAGLPGASVTFVASFSEGGLDLDLLEVRAGLDGAHVVDPAFIPYVDGGPDETLAFAMSGVDVAVPPLGASALGEGGLSLSGLAQQAALVVRFALAEPAPDAAPAAAPDGDPCGRLDAFTALASGPLEQRCASCHAGDDAPATAALDLRGIADAAPAAQAVACARVRGSLDLERPMSSPLFTEVSPIVEPDHPFRFGGNYDSFRTFRTAVLQWIVDRQEEP